MKLSKSLIQAIAVGITLGTTTASCDLVETIGKDEIQKEQDRAQGDTNDRSTHELPDGGYENCPACGMG